MVVDDLPVLLTVSTNNIYSDETDPVSDFSCGKSISPPSEDARRPKFFWLRPMRGNGYGTTVIIFLVLYPMWDSQRMGSRTRLQVLVGLQDKEK